MLQALIKLINLLVLLVLSLFAVVIFAEDEPIGCDTHRGPDVPCTSASGVIDAMEG